MIRIATTPRTDWTSKVEALGLLYHSQEGRPYWNESACYLFDTGEIAALEEAVNQLSEMCLAACQHIIDHDRFADLGIPPKAIDLITRAWEQEPPSLYGRFDLAYSGAGAPPKLLEYNADTPTALLEAAVVQWHWLQECHPGSDQFNSIHERLLGKWRELKQGGYLPGDLLHFACLPNAEDVVTANYLRDLADQAGIPTDFLYMAQIGFDPGRGIFVDQYERPISSLFKLYPWEWMLDDKFSVHLHSTASATTWIEPIWKMLLSGKGILALLWELYPDHPYLLPAYLDGPRRLERWVRKPLWGREGANVSVVRGGQVMEETPGEYGRGGWVFQDWRELPVFDGWRPVLGCWVVDHQAAGLGIRESRGWVTQGDSPFVPHCIS
ncbi:MAG: glutathionylspermidine synthase family protein [Desulfarculus sp.]|nr:glutathionylspermidine synthase family protein [Desulfarculus sp.]